MKRILVVCGAGASSTFLVHWMRKAAAARGLGVSVLAASSADLPARLLDADALLVGNHLSEDFAAISATADSAGVVATLLPPLAFDAAGAGIALDLALDSPTRPITPPLTPGSTMAEQTVTIASAHGLHARPASLFTQAASKSGLDVQISKAGKAVNAASILGVISLGIEHNDEVLLTAEGDNAEGVIAELVALLSTDHDA